MTLVDGIDPLGADANSGDRNGVEGMGRSGFDPSAAERGGTDRDNGSDAGGMQVPVPPFRQRDVIFAPWPYRDTLELGSLPGAVPCARLHIRQLLWEWGMSELSPDAELLVSELVTNAIAIPQPPGHVYSVRLWLLADGKRALIMVWDPSPRPPVPEIPDDDAESGRGLMLIEAISEQWDWYLPHDTPGKVVWAVSSGR